MAQHFYITLISIGAFVGASNPSVADEIARCNDQAPLEVMLHEFEAKKQIIVDIINLPNMKADWSSGSMGMSQDQALAVVRGWKHNIENIRQTGYDVQDDIRYCEAAISVTPKPFPSQLALLIQIAGHQFTDSVCGESVVYKIERLLDKPDEVSVTWQCESR